MNSQDSLTLATIALILWLLCVTAGYWFHGYIHALLIIVFAFAWHGICQPRQEK